MERRGKSIPIVLFIYTTKIDEKEQSYILYGMIKVNKQIKTGNSTILLLDSEIPHIRFSKLLIDGEEYKPEIVYDLKNSIGVLAIGDFEGKEIRFIP